MDNKLSYSDLQILEEKYGDAFYIFNLNIFKENLSEFLYAFREYYPNTNIGYSYKTNYLPYLCRKANESGAYAEIVSELELQIAKTVGVNTEKIIYNGPDKSHKSLEHCLLNGSKINVDHNSELDRIIKIIQNYPGQTFNIGIRLNFNLNDGFKSRFGFDIDSKDFSIALGKISKCTNLELNGIHYHSTRPDKSSSSYLNRLNNIIMVARSNSIFKNIKYIDIGGGFFGKMDDNIKNQFQGNITQFEEYGRVIAGRMKEEFPDNDIELIVEPGLAMTVNILDYYVKITNIKNINGELIATTTGSFYQVKPSGHKKNLTAQCISSTKRYGKSKLDYKIAGYTCLENDFLHENYNGYLEENDYLRFQNVGAYTIVFNPPFIKLAPAIICLEEKETNCVRTRESFENIFKSYLF